MKDHFKRTAALVGEPVRATILWTLLDGRSFTATELALAADTSSSNISAHLSKLVNGGLLKLQTQGRYRYYSLSGKEIAYAVETLAALIPYPSKIKSPVHQIDPAIQKCRTCYDHLAGKTGVAITEALLKHGFIKSDNQDFELTARGIKWFLAMDIPVNDLLQQRRTFLKPCLDWSERRYHMAGSLPAAFLDKMTRQDWIRKTKNSRAMVVTSKGQKNLYDLLKIVL